jgi:DNA replication protein DnaC
MRSFGEILSHVWPMPTVETPPDPEDLVGLPPTPRVQAQIEIDRHTLAEGAYGDWTRTRLSASIELRERLLRACRQRDELQARRPEGCWCLGLGGRTRAYLPPVDASLVLPDEIAWYYREHCACAEGTARKRQDLGLQAEAQRLLRVRAVARLWGRTGVPEHFRDWSFDTFPVMWPDVKPAVASVQAWLDGDRWLLIHGSYGTGKTGLAIAAMRALVERGHVSLFVTVPDLLARVRQTFGGRPEAGAESDVMDSLIETDVLVLDDMGAERVTGWVSETMFRLINARHDRRRRTIVTSNLAPAELGDHVGQRTMWRIIELAEVVHMDGPNLREQQQCLECGHWLSLATVRDHQCTALS